MSEEMAVSDNTTGDEPVSNDEAVSSTGTEPEAAEAEAPSEPAAPEPEEPAAAPEEDADIPKPLPEELKQEPESEDTGLEQEEVDIKPDIDIKEEFVAPSETEDEDDKRGIKRRASSAFSDAGDEEFKGFEDIKQEIKSNEYQRILERLEAEVTAASKDVVPIRSVMATPPAPLRASKRARQDTDGSRPSSALSSRSEGDDGSGSSPAQRGGRRGTTELSSPLLRVPLERGWKRELVYRAALDAHSRRNVDIYYHNPQGKKLRSSREVSEHLAGTGLTLENFSFGKEPLGVDDPEKEIIRDAKMVRRVESPEVRAKPKPRADEPPPAKLKVKSVGSRLSTNNAATPPAAPATTPAKPQKKTPQQQITPSADNNNTAAWKKPSPAPASERARPAPPAPPPLTSRPPALHHAPPPPVHEQQPARSVPQPCSMACGRGAVPSLSCAACLCLYHPACAGYAHHKPQDPFFCKNCRKSPPPVEPPPLTHKSAAGVRRPTPIVPTPAREKRVTLRMKVAGGTADGERVWAVSGPQQQLHQQQAPPPAPPPPTEPKSVSGRARAGAGALPQSLAVLNGRRFIVVPRSVINAQQHEENKRVRRVANGTPPATSVSPRRRGRQRADETDHFAAFYAKAQERNYNVVVQIFQYLGMRELAHCARVSTLWRQLAATPALWRHVRMKNSHVSDWAGLCAALKRHGTKRLDLRKMLLPQNDTVFWDQFAENISTVDTLERIELCRCPARAVEAVCRGLPGLRALAALAIRDAQLDPAPLAALPLLHELRLKSMAGLSLTRDLRHLAALTKLQHLSLTSIKELGWCACDVIGELPALESLELGECTFRASFAGTLARLARLRRLRLERGTPHCAAPDILRALSTLPLLTRLELVNIDVKPGFDDALAACTNVRRLLIIPTYVSQSATTNRQVLAGVLRLRDSLTHLVWGVTIELLRVTELFIDQCERAGSPARRDVGECIPVLKPVPGASEPAPPHAGPPQVEILPLPTLQRLLQQQLPTTKLKLLRIPFHATWRQSLADFQ